MKHQGFKELMKLNTSQQPKTDFSRICVISNININLIITRERGNCFKCQKDQDIHLISERSLTQETRKHCLSCAIEILNLLDKREYETKNKQVIQEILHELK